MIKVNRFPVSGELVVVFGRTIDVKFDSGRDVFRLEGQNGRKSFFLLFLRNDENRPKIRPGFGLGGASVQSFLLCAAQITLSINYSPFLYYFSNLSLAVDSVFSVIWFPFTIQKTFGVGKPVAKQFVETTEKGGFGNVRRGGRESIFGTFRSACKTKFRTRTLSKT